MMNHYTFDLINLPNYGGVDASKYPQVFVDKRLAKSLANVQQSIQRELLQTYHVASNFVIETQDDELVDDENIWEFYTHDENISTFQVTITDNLQLNSHLNMNDANSMNPTINKIDHAVQVVYFHFVLSKKYQSWLWKMF